MHPENGERFAGRGLVVTRVAQDWPDCRSCRPHSPALLQPGPPVRGESALVYCQVTMLRLSGTELAEFGASVFL